MKTRKPIDPRIARAESRMLAARPGTDSKVNSKQDGVGKKTYTGFNDRCAAKEVGNRDPQRHVTATKTTDWQPTCECDSGEPIPSIVCDPFTGSGTVAAVALDLGRRFVGTELNPDYIDLIERRVTAVTRPLFV
jgi:hypothetical protein